MTRHANDKRWRKTALKQHARPLTEISLTGKQVAEESVKNV